MQAGSFFEPKMHHVRIIYFTNSHNEALPNFIWPSDDHHYATNLTISINFDLP